MPPRIDPYSTKTHKRIDVILVLMTVLLIAFAFRTAAQQRATSAVPPNHSSVAQQATSK
jgi:biopolymer transport protein ExbD